MTLDQKIQIWIGLVTVLAVVAGPILALYIQSRLNIRREKRERRTQVFKTLMATRATRLSADHVIALNMIDVEFYGNKPEDKAVIRAWNSYRYHLNTIMPPDLKLDDPKIGEWFKEGDKLFLALLDKTAAAVGYDFEELLMKKGAYIPKAHRDIEDEQIMLRKGLLNLLAGNLHLKMAVLSLPQPDGEETKRQKKIQELSIEYFEGKRPMPVTIISEEKSTSAAK